MDFEDISPRGSAHGADERVGAWQRTRKGKSKGTPGSSILCRTITPQQDGRGRRSASARAEHAREATDGSFAVYLRGVKVDLIRTAREKFYIEQIFQHTPVSDRGRFQFRANRFSGAGFHIDCVSVGDGLALLRQARDTKLTFQLGDEPVVDIPRRRDGRTTRAQGPRHSASSAGCCEAGRDVAREHAVVCRLQTSVGLP